MDTHDSPRPSVPARLAPQRSLAPARIGGGPPEVAASSPISLQVAIRGARRYWWLILMLWTVGSAGLGAVVYLNIRPIYRAASFLRVDPAATNLYGIPTTADQLDPFLKTQVQLITSPNVLTAAGTNPKAAVLKRIQTAGDVVIELRKALSVSVVPETYLIEVAMSSPSAYESATLVNAVVDAFIEANVEWSEGMTRAQIKNLETYSGDLKNQSEELERRWRELVARGHNDAQVLVKEKQPDGTIKTEAQGAKRSALTLDQYRRVQQELFEVNLALTQADAWLTAARSVPVRGPAPSPALDETLLMQQVTRRFRVDPEAVSMASRIKEAERKVDDVKRVARDGSDPALRVAQQKLDHLNEMYNSLWESKRRSYREQAEGAPGEGPDTGREIREAELKVAALKVRQQALKQEFDKLEIDNRKQASDEVDIALIVDQRESLGGMQDAVNKRLEQLKFEAKGEARIRAVDEARPPGRPISDNRLKYLAMTPVGVLGTVLGLIVLLEMRSARVVDPDALSSRIRQEVFSIAPLPEIRPDDANDDKAEQRLARFVQSLDHLRVALCDGGGPGEGRCVMITSATGGEGKTTLSAHLAARCANAGTTTLLIDADMRRASLGRLLDVPVGPGLGDVLAGEVDLDDATITVQAGGFHFLSAGTLGRDPSRVLKSSRLCELLGRLRQAYDLIIIDTPPILPVADALIMGRWADGAVMASRFDASRLPLVERANRQLAAAGIPVLGVVVNGVKGREASYGHYNYSYTYPGRDGRSAESGTA